MNIAQKMQIELSNSELTTLVRMIERFDTLIITDVDIRNMLTGHMITIYKRLASRIIAGRKQHTIKLKAWEASALRYTMARMHDSDNSNTQAIYEQMVRDNVNSAIWEYFTNLDHQFKYARQE